jgi:hypothetical protein
MYRYRQTTMNDNHQQDEETAGGPRGASDGVIHRDRPLPPIRLCPDRLNTALRIVTKETL